MGEITAGSIQCWFGDRPVTASQLRGWEARRAAAVLKWLGEPVPAGDVEVRRDAVLAAKLSLGRAEIARRLARQVAVSDRVSALASRGSGRRRLSVVELQVPGVSADQLPAWYEQVQHSDDEAVMLEACPDHHLFRPTADGRQEVWETTGGSPLASRFFISLDGAGVTSPADPAFPVRMAGGARLADGTLIGAVHHQFRDQDGGTRARLTVELPWLLGPFPPAAHRWHLASEFTNWFVALSRTL